MKAKKKFSQIKKEFILHGPLLVCIGIFATALMFWTMAYGPGISPDSTRYFAVAKNLLTGDGFYGDETFVSHYPPAYPIILATVNYFESGNNMLASRLLHAILFGANVCLVVYAIQKCTDHSFWTSILIMLIFILSPPLILIHSVAWSESPFLFFSLSTLLLCSLYCIRPSAKILLAVCSTCSLAIVTRYIGIILLPVIIFGIVLFGDITKRDKIRDSITVTVLSCLPISIWVFSNLIETQSAADRSFAIHLIDMDHIEMLIETFYYFFFPIPSPRWLQAFLIFGIAIALLSSVFRVFFQTSSSKENRKSYSFILISVCIMFFLMYISFLIASISFFDAHTPLDFRILAPAFIALIIVTISLIWHLFQSSEQRFIKWGLLSLVVLSIATNSRPAVSRIINIHNNGIGYSSKSWRNSETIHYLKSVFLNDSIYTNGADVYRFWTGLEAIVLPKKIDETTLIPNDEYAEKLHNLCNDVKEGNATIIFFTDINRSSLPKLSELKSKCDLPILMELNDGYIFGQQVITNFE
jgi:hypothetical protein